MVRGTSYEGIIKLSNTVKLFHYAKTLEYKTVLQFKVACVATHLLVMSSCSRDFLDVYYNYNDS